MAHRSQFRALFRGAPYLLVVFSLLACVCAACARSDAARDGASSGASSKPPATTEGDPGAPRAARRALLEIHAELEVDASADEARRIAERLDALARERGGFVASSSFDESAAHVVARVPADAIGEVRRILAGAGPIARERETATDVTDAVADLDARARAAHQEEARLLRLLDEKTASLGDVLAAEKALAEVREKIERLDAEQRVAHERVDLATVDVTVRIPTTGGPIVARLADAARDGVVGAREVSLAMVVLALRVAPTSLLLAAAGWILFVAARRMARRGRRDRVPSRA